MFRSLLAGGATLAAIIGFGAAAEAQVVVTVEAAGVQATTLYAPAATYIEDFGSFSPTPLNGNGLVSLPTFVSTFGGSAVSGTFTGFELGLPASYGGNGYMYGGAYGSAQYGAVHGEASITLSQGVLYFGLWVAALDGDNTIELFNGSDSLGSYNLVNTIGVLSSDYFANPNNGTDAGEKFAFVNFSSLTPITSIQFHQSGGGFEFDNLTLAAAVPEPASWAMMVAGFGLMGAAMRRKRTTVAFS